MRTVSYELIRTVVRSHTGIVIEDGKEALLRARLLPIARAYGLASVDELCAHIDGNRVLREEVIEAMTTNETRFFRDQAPFDALVDFVIPDLMERNAETRTLRIWSAACSTGQEPYSVAMVLHEHFPSLAGWEVQILATDLSRKVLERAREGRYRRVDVGRGLTAQQLKTYFDESRDLWTIKPHLRQRVEFRYHNLTTPWPRLPRFDIVFLRNVLIYFDRVSKRAVLDRTWNQLADSGYLFLGASETPPPEGRNWRRLQAPRAGCYQRVSAPMSPLPEPSL